MQWMYEVAAPRRSEVEPVAQRFPPRGGLGSGSKSRGDRIQVRIDRDRRLRRVDRYVRERLSGTIRLEEAAAVAALSRTYFSTYFRQKAGISFCRWLQRLRVDLAIRLMATTSCTLREIGYRSGFRDARTLQRAFVRHLGASPSAVLDSVQRFGRRLPTPHPASRSATEGRSGG